MRRLGVPIALAVALLGASATVAAARDAVAVTLHEPGNVTAGPTVVTLEALAANGCKNYGGPSPALYDQHGSLGTQGPYANSWSLATVLECGLAPGVSPSAVTRVIVKQLSGAPETGRSSILTTPDLSPTGDFADGAQPLIASDGTNILYYRPWRGGSDQNAGDKVEEPPPSPLSIDVYEGPPLTVVAQASSATVTAGAALSFSASVTDANGGPAPDPSTLSYSWDFDGGAADSTAATPTVTFPTAGTYGVTVEVTDTAGGGGADTTLVAVNPAANTPTTPAPPPGAPPTGPQQGGGTLPGAGPGKPTTSHGPSTTRHPVAKTGQPTKSPTASRPSAVTHTKTTAPATSAAPSATTTPAATATTPATTHPAAAATTPVKGPQRRRSGAASSAGTVDGLLISNVVALPVQASPLVSVVAATPATAPAVRRTARASIVPALAGVLAILVLLGLGARYQLGWPRPPRTSLRPAEG